MYLERVLLRSNQVNSKGGLVCFVLTVANSLTKSQKLCTWKKSSFSVTTSFLIDAGNSQPHWQRGDFKE